MKRQTKPFAVEIKRSRRSTPLNEISSLDLLSNKITSPEPVQPFRPDIKSLQSIDRHREDADLKIPVFLQGSKDAPRPLTEHEIAAASLDSSFWKLNKDAEGRSSLPQILPCVTLMPEDESINVKPPKKTRVHLTKLAFEGAVQDDEPNPNLTELSSGFFETFANPSVAEPDSHIPQSDEFAPDATLSRPKRRGHRFLKVDRESAASLPPGQRWKRRLLSRAR